MKKGFKKVKAQGNFNALLQLNADMSNYYKVSAKKFCGNWNGMNFDMLQFYCSIDTLDKIKQHCAEAGLNSIKFS